MAHTVTPAENRVLHTLLDMERGTTKEVHARLEHETGWAHPTVVTFLRRLQEKGYVLHKKSKGGRAFVYHPSAKGRLAGRRLVHDMVDRFFGGNPLPLVSELLSDAALKPEEISMLRKLLHEHEQRDKIAKKKGQE